MALPADLLLVRHGESEGNVAVNASKRGDESYMHQKFMEQHSSRWRLSVRGREQAQLTGLWLRENFPGGFDRYYVSEFTRALETAALLDLPDANWYINPYLRERWRGDMDRISLAQKSSLLEQSLADKKTTPYYWRPPNGESLVEVGARLRLVLETLHRECSGKRVIIVCHGEVMEAFRIELEQMREHQYLEWDQAKETDKTLQIRNCQIFHYSRREPGGKSAELAAHMDWKRSLCPSLDQYGDWHPIQRKRYSSQDLLELAETAPHLFAS